MSKRTIFLLLFAISAIHKLDAANVYGLRLVSYESPGEDRTTLKLNNGEPIDLANSLEIHFRMSIRENDVFGDIFSVYLNDGTTIDYKITFDERRKFFFPTLIVGNSLHPIDYPLQNRRQVTDIPAMLRLNRKSNQITFKFGEKERTVNANMDKAKKASFFFGSQCSQGGTADIAPVDIWDVEMERNGKPLYHWDLRNHNDSVSLDKLKKCPAVAVNGKWLLDDHTIWKRVFTMNLAEKPQYAFNSNNGNFYILTKDSLVSWNAATEERQSHKVRGERLVKAANYLYVDEEKDALYTYSFKEGRTSLLDFNTYVWDNASNTICEGGHIDHTKSSRGGDTFYAFGGYGYYRYHNDLFRVNTASGEITQLKYSPLIEPRVSMASTLVGDTLFIFGGTGNKEGRQELPQVFYNDLWKIDLTTMKAQRLWVADSQEQQFLASQMYFDADSRSFYVFTSNRQLVKVSLASPTWRAVTESIDTGIQFKEFSYGLYKSEKLNKMFVVAILLMENAEYDVQIYSLDLPIIDNALVSGADDQAEGDATSSWLIPACMLLAAILLAALAVAYKHRKRRKRNDNKAIAQTPPQQPTEERKLYDTGLCTIQMLGDFVVLNKKGDDITSKITKRTRDLLIMLLLHSVTNEKGVMVRQLDEALWQGMDDEAARNNRSVYMHKLRVLFEEIGDIEIVSDKIYCRARMGDDVFFDYQEALRLMERMEKGEEKLTGQALELLLRGPLLTKMSAEWLDGFKGDYSSKAIRLLNRLERQAISSGDEDQAYRIAEAIMLHDPFSEEALTTQCRILCRKKNVGFAKHVYDQFCKNYEQAMGEKFEVSFTDICKRT